MPDPSDLPGTAVPRQLEALFFNDPHAELPYASLHLEGEQVKTMSEHKPLFPADSQDEAKRHTGAFTPLAESWRLFEALLDALGIWGWPEEADEWVSGQGLRFRVVYDAEGLNGDRRAVDVRLPLSPSSLPVGRLVEGLNLLVPASVEELRRLLERVLYG